MASWIGTVLSWLWALEGGRGWHVLTCGEVTQAKALLRARQRASLSKKTGKGAL